MIPLAAIGLMFVGAVTLMWYLRPPKDPCGTFLSEKALSNLLRREGKLGDRDV